MRSPLVLVLLSLADWGAAAQSLDPAMHDLRFGPAREWEEFAEQPGTAASGLPFTARANDAERTLRLRNRNPTRRRTPPPHD